MVINSSQELPAVNAYWKRLVRRLTTFHLQDAIAAVSPTAGGSMCEWKGVAQPLVIAGVVDARWHYIEMFPEFAERHEWIAFCPNKLECYVGDYFFFVV